MERISNRIYSVGVNDTDKILFEGLWPLPYGVSYNSYLVVDEKVALIDTVEGGFEDEFLSNIHEAIGDRPVVYEFIRKNRGLSESSSALSVTSSSTQSSIFHTSPEGPLP